MTPGRAIAVRVASRTDPGLQRPDNEDAALAAGSVLAVADGMGGHEGGEVASALAIAAIRDLGPSPDSAALEAAFSAANASIRAATPASDAASGMGTTCTAATIRDGVAHVVHIGDSRAYLLRDGALRQVTEDHALVAQMVRAGLLTEEQASHDERRHVILRALGVGDRADVDVIDVPLAPGDRLLLCTDGLHGAVPDAAILEVLASVASPADAADALVRLAITAGGPDNVTVVVADIEAADVRVSGAADALASVAPARAGAADGGGMARGGRRTLILAVVVVAVALLAVAAIATGLVPRPGTPVATQPPATLDPGGPAKPTPSPASSPSASPGGSGPSPASSPDPSPASSPDPSGPVGGPPSPSVLPPSSSGATRVTTG